MLFDWLQSQYLRNKDRIEIARIRTKYGDRAQIVLRDRVNDPNMPARDKVHWKRMARKL